MSHARVKELDWGHRYLTVRPDHFRIEYQINPYMDPANQPDPERAMIQWQDMVDALETSGAQVEILDQREDSPDMVYAQNLGLAVTRAGRRRVVMSHMRFPQRRLETFSSREWFAADGFDVDWIGGVAPHSNAQLREADGDFLRDAHGHRAPAFEAGDAFLWRDEIVTGHGPRTDVDAIAALGRAFDVQTHGVGITHPSMFHLDLSFCPITQRTAMIAPDAFDLASAELLISLVPDPLIISIEEALAFAANVVVVGDTVLGDGLNDRLVGELTGRGLHVVKLALSEFRLSGGSVRCLTNPLDLTL